MLNVESGHVGAETQLDRTLEVGLQVAARAATTFLNL
jgi:hypothetical protein